MEIRYKNKATQTVNSGTITFTHDPLVSLLSVSENSATSSPTGFAFAFTNLLSNESRSIITTLQIPTIPTVNLNQILTQSAVIEPLLNDTFPLNNSSVVAQGVVAAYDPNDKMEIHGREIDIDEFSSADYLTYTIRFENVGNASAEFIRVEDVLDNQLDENSLVMLSSSHSYDLRRNGNELVWYFYTINLPPTSVSPELSQGYIQFKIKPKSGFVIGDTINNKADIYFDYNPPITTNTFETVFVEQLKTTTFSDFDFTIHPNPTNSIVQISFPNTNDRIEKICIYDVMGKQIQLSGAIENNPTIDVSSYAKGMYLIEITTENSFKTTKKLVVK